MLAYFPRPYENETMYSIAARYAKHMGIISKNTALEDLFDIKKPIANEDYISRISILVPKIRNFSNEYTGEYFLNKHTVSPLFSPYTNKYQNSLSSIDKLMKGRKRYIKEIPIKESLFYCSECIKENIDKYGECYWNRIFQLPGVMICGKHGKPLSKSRLNILKNPINKFIMPDEDLEVSEEIKFDNGTFEQLLKIETNVEYFFINKVNTFTYLGLYEKYFEFIKVAGIAIPLARFKIELGELILSKFNEKTLDILNSNPLKNDWLSYLSVERIKHIHPIRHVLLMMALAQSVEGFINTIPQYQPFGSGPWICMNPLAEHYLEKVISNVNITFYRDKGDFQGEFKCCCGFTYVLYAGETNPREINMFSHRIKEKGETWKKEFDDLVSRGVFVKDIALKTNHSRATVSKIIKEGHNYIENEKRRRQQKLDDKRRITERRDKQDWIEIRKKHPNYSRTELMYEYKAIYSRILRYDREWLIENLPTSQRGVVKTGDHINQKRDLLYLKDAQDMLNSWSVYEKQAGKIIKRTQFTLYTRLGMTPRNNDNYPLTANYISSVTESHEDYQIRLINQCIENYFKYEVINKYKLLALGGLRYLHPKAEKYLESIIKEHNNGHN